MMQQPNTHAVKHPHQRVIDEDGFEHIDGETTHDRSPEGIPGDHTPRASIIWMIIAAIAAVLTLALITLLLIGPWGALVVVFLGGALAVGANPVMWASALRSQERD
jgi:hypothetical protein